LRRARDRGATLSRVTRDDLAAAISRATDVSREDIEHSADLLAAGLDSLGVLRLVNELRVHGLPVTYQDLAGEPTLDGWWRRISALLRANPHLAA
jgi:bifunctional isochorismate lyase / aryl carrier protein